MQERTGIIVSRGKPLTLVGNEVKAGDKAPDFTVLNSAMETVRLDDYRGKVVVISTLPSLETQICDLETRRFSAEAEKLGGDVVFISISMDLPLAQKRWSDEAEVKNIQLVSDHKDASFGLAYGVLIKELRLLARTVFIIGKNGKIEYIQYVKETASEPDYDEVLAAVMKIMG